MELLAIYRPKRISLLFTIIIASLLFGVYFIYTQKFGINCLMLITPQSDCMTRELPFTNSNCHTTILVCKEDYYLALIKQVTEIILIPYIITILINYIILVPIINKLLRYKSKSSQI